MRLYRKIIPKIARDVIRGLSAKNAIEVDESHISEAELDLAAVMVEHVDAEERVNEEAREALTRRGQPMDKFAQTRLRFAEARGVKVGEEGIEALLQQLVEALFASKNIAEIFFEDHELKKFIRDAMQKYLQVSEEVDKEARARLKNVREGTPEWDVEYPRMVAQIRRHKGL